MEEHGSGGPAESANGHLSEGEVSPHLARWKLNRRQLLQLAAGAAAVGAASRRFGPIDLLGGSFRAVEASPAFADASSSDFSVSVLRARDLLKLRFDFFNLQLKTDLPLGQRLEKVVAGRPGFIVVHFPPQNIAEEAYLEADPYLNPGGGEPLEEPGNVSTRLAGSSRLAFVVPEDVDSIPYKLDGPDGLLAWERFEQKVVPAALPPPFIIVPPGDIIISSDLPAAVEEPLPGPVPGPIPEPDLPPPIREPLPTETAIEAPWHLIISPNKFAAWAHARDAVTRNGRTELWHTRLGVRGTVPAPHVNEESELVRKIRAVWTLPTFDKAVMPPDPDPPLPFRMSLTDRDRWEFVRLTADFDIAEYQPRAVDVDRLMLTSLGAWMNVRGKWGPPAGLTREEWRHRGTMGRDHYVRVVIKGYLFPFGHPASLVVITERKFQPVESGPLAGHQAAYLRQRYFIIVRKPEMTYPAPGQPNDGRQMPFTRVRIATLVTPSLDDPLDSDILGQGKDAFWPQIGGQAFLFHLVAEDRDRQSTEFTAPLAFVSNRFAHPDNLLDALRMVEIISSYGQDADMSRRKRLAHGQKIAYAPSTAGKPGDTTLETEEVTLGATRPEMGSTLPPDQPPFYPTLAEAKVRLSAAEQASGGNAPATIEFHPTYLADEFNGANKGAVFARMKGNVPLDFQADKSGGAITPNMSLSGISRALGPVGGNLDATLGGDFNPAAFFQGALPKILGGISLVDIILGQPVDLSPGATNDKIPKITSRVIYPGGDATKPPEAAETKLSWKPEVQQDEPAHIFQPVGPPGDHLSVNATFITKLDSPGDSTSEVVGEIRNFKVNLLGDTDPLHFLTITFNKLKFTSINGEKPDMDVDVANVEFYGVLALVNELQSYLQSGSGFSGIDILPPPNAGIKASYAVGLPSVAVGVFSLQNISLSAGLTIPFSGEAARLRFAFCERENPFLLTVTIFGGGGFFGLGLGLDGFEMVEASLEFGGNISIDIGVASGGVYIMAGVYFKLEVVDGKDQVTLTGYLRMGGELEVLGIVSLSLEFYMGLTYESATDEVWGQASLTVEVEVLFFSASVTMSVERKFAGSTHPLTFIDLVPPNNPLDFTQGSDAWNEYADAFATVPA